MNTAPETVHQLGHCDLLPSLLLTNEEIIFVTACGEKTRILLPQRNLSRHVITSWQINKPSFRMRGFLKQIHVLSDTARLFLAQLFGNDNCFDKERQSSVNLNASMMVNHAESSKQTKLIKIHNRSLKLTKLLS